VGGGEMCSQNSQCISGNCVSSVCTSGPTPPTYTCTSLGGSCVSYGCTCGKVSGGTCQGEDECCKPCPTSTPKPPTAMPTIKKDCCYRVYGSENCSANSGSFSACNALTSKGCVWQCTVPAPTKTCSKTGGACNSQGDCCSGNVCWNGHCYVSSGPSPTPTTGTNPPNPPGGCSGSKPADKCESKTLFINAQCINNRWDWDEQSCNSAGRTESCGGKNYCCPSTGGAWTTDMSKCPTTCTQCVGKPEAKSKGDADCSGVTNLNDFSIWRDEFITGALGVTAKNSWRADFDCNGKVSLNDFSIWRDNFIKSL
ncbi:MAG TPA: hypothetical protein PK045_02630, partial [Candidatus Woesebacteria bacterium]|nr:hypothetical protein [Candidatus Woesebacteria bacterium]